MKKLNLLFLLVLAINIQAQNVGIGTPNPIGKLTVNAESSNWNFPSLLLVDDSPDNNGGAILQFRNPADKRMYLQSHFGTMANGSDTYMTFSHDATYNMRIRGDGNVGIGNLNPNLAGLMVDKKVGNVLAMFGSNTSGVSIESNFPGIHFNSYFNGTRKTMSTGYTAGAEMNPTTGAFSIYTSPSSTTIGNTAAVFERLNISKDGNVGIGIAIPTARLHIGGDLHIGGAVKIDQNNQLEFGAGIVGKEINAGKIGYGLFTPNTLDIVGGGLDINRKIRFWAEGGSKFDGPINVANISSFSGTATDNINVSANITHTEFTKLGASSLPIKTATFSVDLVKQTGTFETWATASLPNIPIEIRKIISHTAIVTYNDGIIRSIPQDGAAHSRFGKFSYGLSENSGQTNFFAEFDNCDLCPYPAKAIIHITYSDTNIF